MSHVVCVAPKYKAIFFFEHGNQTHLTMPVVSIHLVHTLFNSNGTHARKLLVYAYAYFAPNKFVGQVSHFATFLHL